jgi:hypothetical protein
MTGNEDLLAISFLVTVQILFIILKLAIGSKLSWWIVLFPVWFIVFVVVWVAIAWLIDLIGGA